jgi:hypothetical protein
MTTEKKKSQPQHNIKPLLKVMREGQLCPDGVVIDINWGAFEIGTSVFIPAVNLTRLKKQMQTIAKRKQMQIKGFDRIESGKLGMRFWRIL